MAAIAVLRAGMVSGGRSDPDRHRPGRDDRAQLAVPRRHRGAGQLLPRPIAGDWLPFVERSQHDPPDLRCDLRAHGGATQPGREPGWALDRDQRRVVTNRRSLLRSPGRQRSAGHRPRGRQERRSSLDGHRGLRPPGTGPGGRPSPCNGRAQAPAQGYPPCQRAVARRLGRPGPPPGAQPCYGVRPGRAAAEVVTSYEIRQAAIRQIEDAREGLEALDSLKLNFLNIRQGAELPRATRPI